MLNRALISSFVKANGLVNSLIEENRLSEVGLVVVDEVIIQFIVCIDGFHSRDRRPYWSAETT